MIVIGLSGFAGAGKSTVAEYLVRQYDFTRLSFAKALKDVTAATFGWDRARLEGATLQDRLWREQPDSFWSAKLNRNFSPRYALQYIGTEIFREHVLPSIWCDVVVSQIHRLGTNARVVIDDMRFVNERQAIRNEGGEFLLLRRVEFSSGLHSKLWATARSGQSIENLVTVKDLHPSEWDWLRDVSVANDREIINYGSYDDLYAEVDKWWYTRQEFNWNSALHVS